MVARWMVGMCLVAGLAMPALAAERGEAAGVQLAKFVEPDPVKPAKVEKAAELPERVQVKESFQYYDIDGVTADELRSQMKHNGTTWNDGNIYAALTTWDIRYHYDITAKDGRFQVSEISTEVDIMFHMPRLAASGKAPELLKSAWQEYQEHLQTHESGHRDLAVKSCREIYEALSALGSSPSRDQLERQAQALIKAKFHKLKEDQVGYDAATHHGIKQGAVLSEPTVASAPAS